MLDRPCARTISPARSRSSGGLLLWELVSRVLIANPLFLAAPSQIVYAIYDARR